MTKQELFKQIMHLKYVTNNLKFALKVISQAPAERIDLNAFKHEYVYIEPEYDEPDCKTFYCAFGWLTRVPYFRSLGYALDENNVPTLNKVIIEWSVDWDDDKSGRDADADFGELCYARLFAARGCGEYDTEHGLLRGCPTDRSLAILRFEYRIAALNREIIELNHLYMQSPSLPCVARNL